MLNIRLLLATVTLLFLVAGCTPIENVRPEVEQDQESAAESQAEETTSEEAESVSRDSESDGSEEWGYDESNGPNEWANLNPDYHLCQNGKQQSPIDITKTQKAKLAPVAFNYITGPQEIINTGHSVQLNMGRGSSIVVSGKRFYLRQIHFHAPSEHTIDGKPADMAAHFVHKARDGQTAVVAVMMNGCLENTMLGHIWKKLPARPGEKNQFSDKLANLIKVSKLMPKGRDYYTYRGSLTTPPCTEDVIWLVMKNAVPVSTGQVKSFTDLYPNNARPVQDMNYRVVKTR